MAYIDESFYLLFMGQQSPPTGFGLLAELASSMINALCGAQIGPNLASYESGTQTAIMQATAAQLAYLDAQGGLMALATSDGSVDSAAVGKFSYSAGRASGTTVGGIGVSPLVEALLLPTGLLYRGCSVCGL